MRRFKRCLCAVQKGGRSAQYRNFYIEARKFSFAHKRKPLNGWAFETNKQILDAYHQTRKGRSAVPIANFLNGMVNSDANMNSVNVATLLHCHAKMNRGRKKMTSKSNASSVLVPPFGDTTVAYLANQVLKLEHKDFNAWSLEQILYGIQSLVYSPSRDKFVEAVIPKLWANTEKFSANGIAFAFHGARKLYCDPPTLRLLEALTVKLEACPENLKGSHLCLIMRAVEGRKDSKTIDQTLRVLASRISKCNLSPSQLHVCLLAIRDKTKSSGGIAILWELARQTSCMILSLQDVISILHTTKNMSQNKALLALYDALADSFGKWNQKLKQEQMKKFLDTTKYFSPAFNNIFMPVFIKKALLSDLKPEMKALLLDRASVDIKYNEYNRESVSKMMSATTKNKRHSMLEERNRQFKLGQASAILVSLNNREPTVGDVVKLAENASRRICDRE